MGAYLLRRLGEVLPVLLVVATASFLLVKVVPGSPFDTDRPMPAEIKARYEAHYGLDQPTHVQFGRYLANLAQGDLGLSTKYHGWTVNELVAPRIPVSLQLGLLALLLASAVGIPVGVLAASRPDSWLDRIPMGFSLLGICLPSFVIGPLLSLLLSRWLGLVPPCGWGGPEHLLLPVLTLGIVVAAPIARLTRGAMLEVRASDFVRTAQAKGLGPFRVWFVHTLRNALLPSRPPRPASSPAPSSSSPCSTSRASAGSSSPPSPTATPPSSSASPSSTPRRCSSSTCSRTSGSPGSIRASSAGRRLPAA